MIARSAFDTITNKLSGDLYYSGKTFTAGPAGYRLLTVAGGFPADQYQAILFMNSTPVASTVVDVGE